MSKIVLVVSVCLSLLFPTIVFARYVSDIEKERYLEWIRNAGSLDVALAMDASDRMFYHSETTVTRAKKAALRYCKKKSPIPDTCEIADVNGKSDLIKNSSPSTSSSTSSSSQTQSKSPARGGSYELLSSGSFVADCEKNNELDVNYSGKRCDLEWNKLGESNRCKISNSVMTFQTYDSAGQAKLNISSGELKHGVNTYKCTLAGDIKSLGKDDAASTSSTNSNSNSTKVWCAHSGGVAFLIPTTCDAWGGTAYEYEYQAKEANRLGKN